MHRTARTSIVAGLALVTTLTLATPAFAAKPGGSSGGGGSSSVSVVMVDDANGDGLPSYGDTITFDVSTTATSQPYVQLDCSQGGAVVYQHQAGFYAGYPWSQNYVLSSSYWTGGAASCKATLEYNSGKRTVTLTTLSFTA